MDPLDRRFASHLDRAGELLRSYQIDRADAEIATALALKPRDPAARNLLGMVRFRADRLTEALAIYRELCAEQPADGSLRLHLALVRLRLGQNDEAAADLTQVLEGEPKNQRAQGYYGLALMRIGDLPGAREAFLRAGQPDLARQVEERLAHPQPTPIPEPIVDFAAVAVSGSAKQRSWLAGSTVQTVPETLAAGPELQLNAAWVPPRAQSLVEFATDRLLALSATAEPLALTQEGLLVARVEGRLFLRGRGAIAASGNLQFAPLQQRARGQVTRQPFGQGDEGLLAATGSGHVLLSPEEESFSLLALQNDVVYLREPVLFAFEDSLSWENGRLPGTTAPIVQLRGSGRAVLRLEPHWFALKVETSAPVRVAEAALCGWIGRVLPHPGEDGVHYFQCSGEGALILRRTSA